MAQEGASQWAHQWVVNLSCMDLACSPEPSRSQHMLSLMLALLTRPAPAAAAAAAAAALLHQV